MAMSGIQGACAAWRNAVNLLAQSFDLEPVHTRAPRKDFEALLKQVIEKYEAAATAAAKNDERQARKERAAPQPPRGWWPRRAVKEPSQPVR